MNILQKCAWHIFLPRKETLNVKFCGPESRALFGNAMCELGRQFSENKEQSIDVIFYITDSTKNTINEICDELSGLKNDSLFFLISKIGEYEHFRLSCNHENINLLTNMTIDKEVLQDDSLEWATSIPMSGKIDYFKKILKLKNFTFFNSGLRQQFTVISKTNINSSWLYAMLLYFNQKEYFQFPVEIGRIDKMRTDNTIIQIMDKLSAIYCIKIFFDNDFTKNHASLRMSWLDQLATNENVSQSIRICIPNVISASKFNGIYYQLEPWMIGEPASLYFYNRTHREKIVDHAIDWSIEFQNASRNINSSFKLGTVKVSRILDSLASKGGFSNSTTTKITRYVSNKLSQYDCPVVSSHGDFWIGNLLVDDNKMISGVIDWDFAEEKTSPLIDIFHILFHRKTMFSAFHPWEEFTNSLKGKLRNNDLLRIKACMDKLGINPGLFTCLLIVYWLKYLDTRYEMIYKKSKWYDSVFVNIHEVLSTQSIQDWDNLSKRMMKL